MKTIRIIAKCLMALLCLLSVVSCKKKAVGPSVSPPSEKTVAAATQDPGAAPTAAQLGSEAFFVNEIQPIVTLLAIGQFPYPEINERYVSSATIVFKEYGKPISCKLSTGYSTQSKYIQAAAGDKSDPDSGVIWIFVPAFQDVFKELQESGHPRWREVFINHFVIVLMHELEHLRFKLRDLSGEGISLTEESRAWDETCRHTIEPLVDKYKRPVLMGVVRTYHVWLAAGKNPQIPAWKREIERMHAPVDAKW